MVVRHLLVLATIFAGCRTISAPPSWPSPEVRAPDEAKAWAESLPDDVHAAEVAWLMANDRAYARKRLDNQLKKDPHHPGARLLRALISEAELKHEAWLTDLLAIVVHRPAAPEAEMALVLLHHAPEAWAPHIEKVRSALARSKMTDGGLGARKVFLATTLLVDIARRNIDHQQERAALNRGGWLTRFRGIGPLIPQKPVSFEQPNPYEVTPAWKHGAQFRGLTLPIRIVETRGRHLPISLSGQPGIYVYDTSFEVSSEAASQPIVLQAHLPARARIRIDGRTVVERLPDEPSARSLNHTLIRLAPGWHRLSLLTSVLRGSRPSMALLTEQGYPLAQNSRTGPLAATKVTSPPEDWTPEPDEIFSAIDRRIQSSRRGLYGRLLGAKIASSRWYRDPDRADSYLSHTRAAAPHSAIVHAAWSALYRRQNLMSLAQTSLEEALAADPTLPTALVDLAWRKLSDQPEVTLELLDRAEAAAPAAWKPHALRFGVYKRREWNAEAISALEHAVQKDAPESILMEGARFLRRIHHLAAADALEDQALAQHPRLRPMRLAQRAIRTGDTEEAIAALELAARLSGTAQHYAHQAEIYLATQRPHAALNALKQALAVAPFDTEALKKLIWTASLLNDRNTLEESWRKVRALGDTSLDLEALVSRQGETQIGAPPVDSWLDQTLEFDPWPFIQPTSDLPPGRDPANRWAGHRSVLVLDRIVDQVLPSGQALSLRHAITRLQTKEAITQAGETDLPGDAYILGLHTLKPDGQTLQVDRHIGKDDVSFSALAPGDAIERKWVELDDAATVYGGYLRRFYFRSASPIIRSEFAVVVPKGMSIWFRSYHGAPEPLVFKEPHQTTYYWRADNIAPIETEPFAVPSEEYLPFVAVTVDINYEQATASNLRRAGPPTRTSWWVKQTAQQILSAVPHRLSPQEKIEAIFRWVVKEIDHGSPADPTDILLTRRGDRTDLFIALLRAAGLEAHLLLARSGAAATIDPPYPNPVDFPIRLVRIRLAEGDQYAHFDSDTLWLGKLAPHFRGGRYLVVGTSPQAQPFLDRDIGGHHLDTKAHLKVDAAGTAKGVLDLELPAALSFSLKSFFTQATEDEVTRQMQGWVSSVIPGAQLTGFEPRGVSDPLHPLTLHAEITVPDFMVVDGQFLVAEQFFGGPVGLKTMRIPTLAGYLQAPQRESALLLRPARERLSVTIDLPQNAHEPLEQPKSFMQKQPFGHYEQRFLWDAEKRQIRLLYHHETPLLRITSDRMPAFKQTAQVILQMLENRLIVPLGEPPPNKLGSLRP